MRGTLGSPPLPIHIHRCQYTQPIDMKGGDRGRVRVFRSPGRSGDCRAWSCRIHGSGRSCTQPFPWAPPSRSRPGTVHPSAESSARSPVARPPTRTEWAAAAVFPPRSTSSPARPKMPPPSPVLRLPLQSTSEAELVA